MEQIMTKKLIIDTDVGIDDAIAILMALADPEWQIVGICGVSGNVGLGHVMRNIGIVLDAAGAATSRPKRTRPGWPWRRGLAHLSAPDRSRAGRAGDHTTRARASRGH